VLIAATVAVEQQLAIVFLDAQRRVLVTVASAVASYRATRQPVPVHLLGVAQGFGYVFC
jgi:hypothetical protein